MDTLGDILITSGQDRLISGHDMIENRNAFQLLTLGNCATTMAFNPNDSFR